VLVGIDLRFGFVDPDKTLEKLACPRFADDSGLAAKCEVVFPERAFRKSFRFLAFDFHRALDVPD
jgi:hypothetical protein